MTKFIHTRDFEFVHPDRIVRLESPNEAGIYALHFIDEHGKAQSTVASVHPHESFELA